MSPRRRDITVDRGVSPVSRTHAHMVVFTGGRGFLAFFALLTGPSQKQTCSPTSGPHLVGHWLSKMLSWPLQEGQKCLKLLPASKNRRISRWGYPPSTDSGSHWSPLWPTIQHLWLPMATQARSWHWRTCLLLTRTLWEGQKCWKSPPARKNHRMSGLDFPFFTQSCNIKAPPPPDPLFNIFDYQLPPKWGLDIGEHVSFWIRPPRRARSAQYPMLVKTAVCQIRLAFIL